MITTTIVIVSFLLLVVGYVSGNQPIRDAVASVQQELELSVDSRKIKVGAINLNVVFAGPESGKPVILLHGYPEFWYAWRGPMAELAKAGYRVIVPDQRGYNDSDKPTNHKAYALDVLAGDVVGLIDALGYDKVCLAGHDFGGLVSWWTLILYPEKIEKFAIVNKPHPDAHLHHHGEHDATSWYRTFLRLPMLPGYIGRLANWGLLARQLRSTSIGGTFTHDHLDYYRAAWDNNGAINSMGAWYRANANFKLNANMHIAVPGLFIASPDDAYSPKGMGQLSMNFLKNGELLELDEGTHWVIQEYPTLIGQKLSVYFKSDHSN